MTIQIVFQTTNPRRLANFWRVALRYIHESPPEGFSSWEDFAARTGLDLGDADIDSAVDPEGHGPRLLFERVDKPTIGDAIHLDINASTRGQDPAEARKAVDVEVARLEAVGASTTKIVEREDRYWVEMTDPDGNWLCIQ